jgi:hypothetical protein
MNASCFDHGRALTLKSTLCFLKWRRKNSPRPRKALWRSYVCTYLCSQLAHIHHHHQQPSLNGIHDQRSISNSSVIEMKRSCRYICIYIMAIPMTTMMMIMILTRCPFFVFGSIKEVGEEAVVAAVNEAEEE